jgi:hypothetical protein
MRSPRRTATAIAVAALLVLLASTAAGAVDPAGQPAGYIRISSDPAGAEVFVNQVRMNGVTPLTLRVPAGQPQEVVVNLYGYEAQQQTVTVQPDETVPIAFGLRTLPGVDRPETETPSAVRSPTASPGGADTTETRAVWVEETPVSMVAGLLALVGAGLLVRRRG